MSFKQRKPKYHYWPIRIVWAKERGSPRWLDWHSWPMSGSRTFPDATFRDLGWTLHLGRLQIQFGD